MYLLKLIVLQGLQLLVIVPNSAVSTDLFVSEINDDTSTLNTSTNTLSLERRLIDTVSDYFEKIERIKLLKIEPESINMCGNTIKYTDIQYLENNMFVILKKMYNYYRNELSNQQTAVIGNRSLEEIFTNLFKSEYVETICTHIPRCIDFIYICSPSFLNISEILKLHAILCYSREAYLLGLRTRNETPDIFLYSSTNNENIYLDSLSSRFLEKEPTSEEIKSHTPNDDMKFISDIFNIINEINTKDLLKTKIKNKDPEIKFSMLNNVTVAEIQKLCLDLKKIIDEQGKTLFKTNNFNAETDSDHNCSLAINKILLTVIQGIEVQFQKSLLGNDKGQTISMDQNALKNFLQLNMLDKFCKLIPAILYYLIFTNNNVSYLFNLYLKMCDDWINFLSIRCRCDKNNEDMLYNFNCVKQSVNDKLLINNYNITGEIEFDNDFTNDVSQMESLESIILSIHNELDNFYVYKEIFIWTSYDWLSGKHIFTETQNSKYLNEIKEHKIEMTGYNEKVPLIELYNQLIPWNLNVKELIQFKFSIDQFFIDRLSEIFWRQAIIILYYFEYINVEHDNNEVYYRLKNSFRWYKAGTPVLLRIMSLTSNDMYFSNDIKLFIDTIENINDNGIDQTFIGLKNTAKNREKKVLDMHDLLNNIKTDFPTNLNRIFLNNCYDALNVINTYISIINKSSKQISNNSNAFDFLKSELCTEDELDNVFMASQSIVEASVKNPESNEEDYGSSQNKKPKLT